MVRTQPRWPETTALNSQGACHVGSCTLIGSLLVNADDVLYGFCVGFASGGLTGMTDSWEVDEEGVACDRALVRCDPSSSNRVEAPVFAI